jgi:hypothetical protein
MLAQTMPVLTRRRQHQGSSAAFFALTNGIVSVGAYFGSCGYSKRKERIFFAPNVFANLFLFFAVFYVSKIPLNMREYLKLTRAKPRPQPAVGEKAHVYQ